MKAKAGSSNNAFSFQNKRVPAAGVPIEAKSAEQHLEDLMGILNNRRDLLEKIIKKYPRANDGHKTFLQYHKQTKKFLASLVIELSAYGDGSAGPDPHNAYNDYWKGALKKWDTINEHRLILFWRELENILKTCYRRWISLEALLPASFQKIIAEQLNELEGNHPKK